MFKSSAIILPHWSTQYDIYCDGFLKKQKKQTQSIFITPELYNALWILICSILFGALMMFGCYGNADPKAEIKGRMSWCWL